jgi:hypothetical protein
MEDRIDRFPSLQSLDPLAQHERQGEIAIVDVGGVRAGPSHGQDGPLVLLSQKAADCCGGD